MAATEPESEPRAKKQFFEKDEFNNHGFSLITLLQNLGTSPNENPGHVLRRCSLDPCNPPGAATEGGFLVTPFHSPEHVNTVANPATPPSIGGSSSGSGSGLPPLPSSLKSCFSDPTPSPVKSFSCSCSSGDLEETHSSMNECGSEKEESEEAVSVEWTEKCLSIHFKCP